MIRHVAGRQNHSVKLARKLQQKKHRRERGRLLGEGLDLLQIAYEGGTQILEILIREDLLARLPRDLLDSAEAGRLDIAVCDQETIAAASSLGGAADVLFVTDEPSWSLADLPLDTSVVLYLDGVGDPGNVGTLIRSCVAFGAGGVITAPGTADPYGAKAMRAGMGAQFLCRIVPEVSPSDLLSRLDAERGRGAAQTTIVVADAHGGTDVRTLAQQARRGVVLVLGAERNGPEVDWRLHPKVTIPQVSFDSLNVAMAGTVLLYELSRARVAIPGRVG